MCEWYFRHTECYLFLSYDMVFFIISVMFSVMYYLEIIIESSSSSLTIYHILYMIDCK